MSKPKKLFFLCVKFILGNNSFVKEFLKFSYLISRGYITTGFTYLRFSLFTFCVIDHNFKQSEAFLCLVYSSPVYNSGLFEFCSTGNEIYIYSRA